MASDVLLLRHGNDECYKPNYNYHGKDHIGHGHPHLTPKLMPLDDICTHHCVAAFVEVLATDWTTWASTLSTKTHATR